MNGINLLPWREERRRVRDRRMIAGVAVICFTCVLFVFTGFTFLQLLQDNQKKRNAYIQNEIQVLDGKLEEIKDLQSKKKDLITRMEVIQGLQRERSRVIQVFNDIVNELPDGIHFDDLNRKDLHFTITGAAQSNARVSNLLGSLESLTWFSNPYLREITVVPSDGIRLSKFSLGVTERTKRKKTGTQNQAAQTGVTP